MAKSVGSVLVAGLLTTWPAVYNGYPLLYPDSISYLWQGAPVAKALFLHKLSGYYGGRSLIYSVGILPLHWNVTPWPVVLFNALVTCYVLWLVVRSLLPTRAHTAYLLLAASLSLLTGLGWMVSWIMPDIFGPVLYLAVYLLVFAPETLSRGERIAVALIAVWSADSHITHLILAGALCVFLLAVVTLRRQATHRALVAIGSVAAMLLLAAGAQLALHAYLYGEPSLTGQRPPFVMARMIADGPGRWYLQRNCPALHFAICAHRDQLPDNVGDFLWRADGIWQTSTPAEQERMRKEERAVVLGTLRSYPREELAASARGFWRQLYTFELSDYDPNPWIRTMVDTVLPGAGPRYLRSRQVQETLPDDFFTAVQDCTVAASLVLIACWAILGRRERPARLIGLAAIIAFVVPANAAVTGVLSNVEARYQARVIWLIPLLAAVLVMTWLDQRGRGRRPPGGRGAAFEPRLVGTDG